MSVSTGEKQTTIVVESEYISQFCCSLTRLSGARVTRCKELFQFTFLGFAEGLTAILEKQLFGTLHGPLFDQTLDSVTKFRFVACLRDD